MTRPAPTRPDVLVVGGGVIGCSVAYHLAREGASVRLLDRGALAGQASGAAAGTLLPFGEAETPGPLLTLGLRGLARLFQLAESLREESGIDCELEASGALHLAFDATRAAALRRRAEWLAGVGLVWLDADEARTRAPGCGEGLVGALWSPREAHLRSPLLTRAYARAAERLGTTCSSGVAVHGVRVAGTRAHGVDSSEGPIDAGHVVLCTGAWAAELGDGLAPGLALPVEPVRGQILSLDAPADAPREMWVGERTYLVPKRDGSLVVGATMERVGFDVAVTADGVAQLLREAFAVMPRLAECGFREAWAGLRPATPDGLPAVGPVSGVEGLHVAVGHFRTGVLLSPVTGELVADGVCGRPLPEHAADLDPLRFKSG